MKRSTVVTCMLVWLVTLGACATPQATQTASERWTELRTPRFEVWTDGDPEAARGLIGDLERFHQVALATTSAEEVEAAPPLRVFIAKDRASFVSLTHADPRVHGLFVATRTGNYAIVEAGALASDVSSAGGRAILFHEYTHYMLAVRGSRVPSWYNEGLAEYMSATELRADGSVALGCPPLYRTAWTKDLRWLPIERVLEAEDLESTVTQRMLTDGYAQAWYLVHYFSADGARKQQLSKYLELWAADVPVAEAVQQAFGMSAAQLDQRLQVYAAEPRFSCLEIKPAKPLVVPPIEQHALLSSEAHDEIGELLLALFGPTDAALDVLAQSQKIDPKASRTSLAFARAHWMKAELEPATADAELQEAERSLQQARAQGDDSAQGLALEGHVQRTLSERASSQQQPYSEALVAARKAYRAAIRKDETCAEAYIGLGKTYLIEDNGSQEAQVSLEAAAYLLPLDTEIALTLARVQIARHNMLQAVPALEYVLRWSKDDRTRGAAKTALDALRSEAAATNAPPASEQPASPVPAAAEPAAEAPKP